MALLGEITYGKLVLETQVTEGGILLSGQNLAEGAVLGRITASGKLKLANQASVDGSQTPFGILLEDCDATSADKACSVLLAGVVDEGKLIFGGTLDADDVRATFRNGGIYLKTVMGA